MKITDIVKEKGNRYRVFVDEEYWYIIDIEIVVANSIKVGLEVDDEFLDQIKLGAERRKARERAYYLLGYRDHSKQELYDKLRKSVSDKVALEIVEMVERQGLIDDEKYANKLANYYLSSKKWGRRRVELEMRRKGVSQTLIAQAIEVSEVDSVQKIVELIDKKYSQRLDDYKEKQKVVASLMRLGFDYSDIKLGISEYTNREQEFEME